MNKFLLGFVLLGILFTTKANAQTPNISYPGPQKFYLGDSITRIPIKNTGGPVPAGIFPAVTSVQLSTYMDASDFVRVSSGDFYKINSSQIYRIRPTGTVSVLAGNITRDHADGTGAAASFQDIAGIANDAAGNLYVTDNNYHDVTNSRIRKVTQAGIVTTIAEGLSGLGAITVDANGVIYFISGARIMKLNTDGTASLLAGKNSNGKDNGNGGDASFGYNLPSISTDKAGNVYVADYGNNMIRKITPDGVVTTFAGSGSYGGQDGMGASASFFNPGFVKVDPRGNVLVSEYGGSLRKITPQGMVATLFPGSFNDYVYSYVGRFALDNYNNLITIGGSSIYKMVMSGYRVLPKLPDGLVLNADGSITGTPMSQTAPATYRVTASNLIGVATADISIEIDVPKKAPVITSFSPAAAASNSYVSIKGNYFTGTTSITFAGKPCKYFSIVSPMEISAMVPDSAASGIIVVTTPYGSARISNFRYLPPPTITSFSPTSGGIGNVITIHGTNFDANTRVNIAGSDSQALTLVSPTTIKATIGPYAYNSSNISVYGNNASASISGFSYIGQPAISSISPNQAATGATITITGSNFNNATTVKFGNTPATSFKVVSPTSITAVVPSNAFSSLTVTTPFGTTNGYSGFSYIPPPVIYSASPMKGGLNSTIFISGNYLNYATVTIGGVAAQISYAGPQYINAVVGAKGANGNIVITTPGGTTTLPGYVFVAAPVIKSFTPQTAAAGDKITITGTNFSEVDNVSIGGILTPFKVLSSTTIEATVGAGASGVITITSEGGSSNASGFTYKGPAIASFSPAQASAGQTVTITGSNFTNATGVDFGGVAATSFTVVSATQITAVVGAGRSGYVTVATPMGKGSLAGFTHPGPLISYFTPNAAGPVSQPQITIYGSNFTGATAVSFGGVAAASFTVNSSYQITATPAVSKSGNVVVTTPLGTDSQTGFIWAGSPPTINSFTPTSQKAGGLVTITGTNFNGVTSVKFGGAPVYVYSYSPTSLTVSIGNVASGAVTVSTVGGTASKNGFIYTSPTIQSISPAVSAAGKAVSIYGNGLDSVKSVTFGNTNAASFTIVSSKRIIAYLGNGASGDVRVTGSTGSAAISGFTFLQPPVIYSVSPPAGGAGSQLSIYGYYLLGTSSVKIGNVAATINSTTFNTVTVTVGAGQTGKISLTTIAGTTVYDGFTWYAAPVITSATPMSANSETQVTITGKNFTGVTEVKFGGQYAGFEIVSPTQIKAMPSYVQSGDITVKSPGGTATLPGFVFLPAPIVTSFTTTGEGANATVTITGTNFNNVNSVQFGGVDAKSFTVLSPTSISAVPGDGATGSIIVTTTGGTSSIPGFLYSYPPSINGDNFNLTPEKNIVFFGPVQAQVVSATKTKLTVTVPAGASDLISVTNTDKKLSVSSNSPFLVTSKVPFSGYANKLQVKLSAEIFPVYTVDDLDGDGKPDILIANEDSLYMLKNTGGPALSRSSFSQKILIEKGKSVISMVVGDVDGDGKKDIVISIPNCIAVLRNTSTEGNLSFDMKVLEYMNKGSGMLLRDMNGDGRPDLIVGTDSFNLSPVAYANTTINSTISFGQSAAMYNPYSGGLISFALTDIDGDNKPDPILGGSYSDITIFKNNSVPVNLNLIEPADQIISHYNYIPWSIAAADLDGDGKPDIIDDTQNDNLFVLRNITTNGVINTSSFADEKPFYSGSLLYNINTADINGDGKIDVVGSSNEALYYTRNLSTKGNISLSSPVSIVQAYLNNISFYDMDGDGKLDVLGIDQNKMLNIYNNSPKLLPQITSISQASAGAGTTITLTGKNFDGTTVVKFGATAAKSFTVTSPQTIDAVVGTGSTGSITVQNADGIGSYAGFTFIQAPVISTAVMLSDKTAMTITGQNFINVSAVAIGDVPATSFTVNSATKITAVFPNTTGTLTVTTPGGTASRGGVTYNGIGNAVISAEQNSGNEKLLVHTAVNRNMQTVSLTLSGGSPYHMVINGINYTTNDSLATLPLNKGVNKLTVTTDRLSQGQVEQNITLGPLMVPYPNPFQDVLYINIGDDMVKQGSIKIFNLSTGVLKLTKQFSNQTGVISIDVSKLELGVYTLHLILDSKESIYKVYK